MYKPYAVYAHLAHGGSYQQAAKALFNQGYGKSAEPAAPGIPPPTPPKAKPVTKVPLDVFPGRLAALITELDENNHFPVPYSLASLLFAASVAVGKSQAIYAAGYKNHPTLWLAMVGMPGMNKSSPLKWFLSPFSKRDKDAYKKYTDEMKQFESLPKSEREGAHKPQRKQHIVQDATLEALQYVLDGNTRGIGVYSDELDTWYSSFDRYNKSGDQSAWLSMWSGITVSKNRVSSRDVYIDNPFCSVIGGLQPSVLKNLGCKDRQNNGFIYRILFVSSDEDKRPPNRKYNPVEEDNRKAVWAACIKNILSVLPVSEDEPQKVTLSKEASDVLFNRISGYRATYNSLRVKCDENYMQLISKLEIYAYRFCLLLNAIHVGFGTDGATTETISGTVAEGAMRLLDYFEGSTLKALEAIISQDEVAALNELQMRIYNALPDRFPTSLALMVAEKSGGSAITMKRMLKNKELFEKIRHGEYGKTP